MTRQDLPLVRRWIVARLKFTLRTPRATFFTFVFPLMFLVIFNALNGDARVAAMGDAGGKVPFAQFYTPSIGIFGLASACYTGVVLGIASARDAGLLKRVRGTPLPMSIYLGAWLIGAALTGIAAVVLLFAVAVPALGVHVYARMLPAALVTLALGAATLAALGLAVASLVRTADQAIPVAQLTFLPLSFISGIFYPLQGAPDWVVHLAHFFPLFHIVNAFDACFVPQTPGGGWSANDLAAIAVWGVIGLVVAARRLRTEPVTGDGRAHRGLPRREAVAGHVSRG
jgi:ABC-2 type transport system permease protein